MKSILTLHGVSFFVGYVLDLLIGDPHGLPHPVILIGKLVAFLDEKLYPAEDRENAAFCQRRGRWMCLVVVLMTGGVTAVIVIACYKANLYLGAVAEALLTCTVLAAKSLYLESRKVYDDLKEGDLVKARRALSMIVGRDTVSLDEKAVTRAAIETVAENTSDGVLAPLLYTALGGPVFGMIYKSINTMDSMVGYRNERYEYFGRPAARLDDAANYFPSRVSAVLLILSAGLSGLFSERYSFRNAFRIWKRDRRNHSSPNSAQTESACAGALGVRLGGSSVYGGRLVEKPYIGDADREPEPEDILRADRLMFVAEALAVLGWVMIWMI